MPDNSLDRLNVAEAMAMSVLTNDERQNGMNSGEYIQKIARAAEIDAETAGKIIQEILNDRAKEELRKMDGPATHH